MNDFKILRDWLNEHGTSYESAALSRIETQYNDMADMINSDWDNEITDNAAGS